jgi:mRNA interferase MazF
MRPCVVVSPGEMHDHLRTVIVAPMTTKSRPAPFRIGIMHGGKKGLILLDQVRAVDKARLAKKLGAVSAKTLTSTLSTLQEVFTE